MTIGGQFAGSLQRWGELQLEEAEDVASLTFMAILEGKLLSRWAATPHSKLRTLICSVVRNVLSNRARVQSGRERILKEQREFLIKVGSIQASDESAQAIELESVFYAAWADELVQHSLQALQTEYLKTNRADYFRVLFGRVCEKMGNAEIAASLNLKVTDVENYYKRTRRHLRDRLQQTLAEQVKRYCPIETVDEEVGREWSALGEYLTNCGGIERAIRNSYEFAEELNKREKLSQSTIIEFVQQQDLPPRER